ncbi:DGQHR domain-containing protein [Variovorax sp. VNK109]|uniref:DGQHR domain-containing protein n=1 Tax=Variovorax sp. VNK109 TaxID=3400919 RepID=UPI003BFBBBA7
MPKKPTKKVKKKIDPQKLIQRRHRLTNRAIFKRLGFTWIKSDGLTFKFQERTGEIDDILIYENIIVITEYTTGKGDSGHLTKKSILYEKILNSKEDWISEYQTLNESFGEIIKRQSYELVDYQLFIVYASQQGVGEEISNAFQHYRFFDGTISRYFDALSKTIHQSARHEFFNYLGVDLEKVGQRVLTSSGQSQTFSGHLLPEGNSGYPKGFKVASFYADPATLLEISYVLRRDSWRDQDGLYQRILIKSKIARMRQYLTTQRRVFVNNIIVTLPSEARLLDPKSQSQVDPSSVSRVQAINLSVPIKANMVGLVDGQHRVFCYHESPGDPLEKEISRQRQRQNLLVTGIIFPASWKDAERREFEAKLFLEINDTQAKAKSVLRQSIEVLLNPFSTIAISKETANRLSRRGPLAKLLQTNFFDPPDKIKTSSIVSYGLSPLVKLEGSDCLYSIWKHQEKGLLLDKKAAKSDRERVLSEYIDFCVLEISTFFSSIKRTLPTDDWQPSSKRQKHALSPTTINGFFVCMRLLIEAKLLGSEDFYLKKLSKLSSVQMQSYKSSAWKSLGEDIYRTCFT